MSTEPIDDDDGTGGGDDEEEETTSVDELPGRAEEGLPDPPETVIEGSALEIDPEVTLVGSADTGTVVAGIELPGAYQFRHRGEGVESQYLLEIEGGGGADENPYNVDEDFDPDGNDPSGGSAVGGDEPPVTVIIEAWVGNDAIIELRELRYRDDTFEAEVAGRVYEEMELTDLDIELEGWRSYAAHVTLEVREWREYEVPGGDGPPDYGQDTDTDGEETTDGATLLPESGEPGEPNVVTLEEDEDRVITVRDNQRLRNVEFDNSAPGASITIRPVGDDFDISSIGVSGENDDGTPVIETTDETGDGRIRDVYIGGEQVVPDGTGLTDTSYDRVVVSGGHHHVERLGDGDTLADTVFDVTADGASVAILANGIGWSVENVALDGENSTDRPFIKAAVSEESSSATISGVYVDGGGTVLETRPSHEGELVVERLYAANMAGSAVVTLGGGDVTVDTCYTKNATAPHLRLSAGTVRNTVCTNDDTVKSTGLLASGDVTTESVQFDTHGGQAVVADGGAVTLHDTQYSTGHKQPLERRSGGEIKRTGSTGTRPSRFVPDSVGPPTSPGEAALGTSITQYEVIKADGQQIRLGDNDIYENKLFDLSTGEPPAIRARGRHWAIRNIGFIGEAKDSDRPLIAATVKRECLIENVHYTDGAGGEGPGLVYATSSSEGELVVRRCNWQHTAQTGVDVRHAIATIDRCYAGGNNTASLVVGDATIDDTVLGDRPMGKHAGDRLLEVHGTTTATNCHIDGMGMGEESIWLEGGSLELIESEWDESYTGGEVTTTATGTSPNLFYPDGVSRTPLEAAGETDEGPAISGDGGSATGSDGDEPRLENVTVPTTLQNNMIDHGTHYEFQVPSGYTGPHIEYHDNAVIQNIHMNNEASGAAAGIWQDVGFNDTDPPASWVIRNVAFTGTIPPESAGSDRLIYAASASGTTGLLENIWACDGDAGQGSHGDPGSMPGFAGTTAGHSGHLQIRNWNVQNFTSHCFYGSRGSGSYTVSVEDSYAVDNQMAAWRLMDGTIENCYWRGVSGVPGSRGVWIWGDADIDNCSADMDGSNASIISRTSSNAHITLSNTEYTGITGSWTDAGGNTQTSRPSEFIPDGVPMDPEDAYLGRSGSTSPSPSPSPSPPSGEPADHRPAIYISPETPRGEIDIARVNIQNRAGDAINAVTDRPMPAVSIKDAYLGNIGETAVAMGKPHRPAQDDFEAVELSEGETYTATITDGETFENHVFDCTAPDTSVELTASGDGWTIRNVTVIGECDGTGGPVITAETDDIASIRGLFLGDGGARTAIDVASTHSGTLNIDRIHGRGWDTLIDAEAPGATGGDVSLSRLYSHSHLDDHVRLAAEGSTVVDSVFIQRRSSTDADGVVLDTGNDDPEAVVLTNCDFSWTSAGDALAGGGRMRLERCRFEGFDPSGVHVEPDEEENGEEE